MAKVAEYEGAVSLKEDENLIVLTTEFMQGEIRTSMSVAMTPAEFLKLLKGQKVGATVEEDAVQTRRAKPKQETIEG